MPVFSVIVPNYNHAPFLQERIETILSQTFTDFELILLDDCSTDESVQILSKYFGHPKVSCIVVNEENSGSPFLQWEKGIALAKSNWVWIAESDDFADKEFLKTAYKAIQQNPAIGLFYCDALSQNELGNNFYFSQQKNELFNLKKWSRDYVIDGKEEINKCLKYYCTINNASSMVFNRTLFQANKREFTKFHFHGDWYFYLLLASKTTIYYCAQPLNFYRQHNNSFTKDFYGSVKSKIDYFRILELLLEMDFVNSKNKLIAHFAGYYLGAGFKLNLFGKEPLLMRYWSINKKITIAAFFAILKLRVVGMFSKKIAFQ